MRDVAVQMRGWLAGVLLGALPGLPATASVEDFLQPAEPRRLALIVGNADYVNVPKLPGGVLDAEGMDKTLRALGFDTRVARNVFTREEFLQVHFLPFARSIRKGDIVVFFFSGHGFAHNGENFLTPLEFSKPVEERDVPFTFMSAKALEEILGEGSPSLLLMFLDACRTIGGFIVKTKRTPEDETQEVHIPKGFALMKPKSENTVIGFSSALGTESLASSTMAVSVYTGALEQVLPSPGKDFDDMKRDIRSEVVWRTKHKQVPWFSESSSAEFYMKPSPQVLQQQLTLWKAALDEGTRKAVTLFLMKYGSGPYGAKARRWLELNTTAPEERSSEVAPAALEAAWSGHGGPARLLAFGGALRPTSTLSLGDAEPTQEVPAPASRPSTAFDFGRFAKMMKADAFVGLGQAVVTHTIQAYENPSPEAASFELRPGTTVAVQWVEIDRERRTWLRVAGDKGEAYVRQREALGPFETVAVGRPLVEVEVKPRKYGLKALVDESRIQSEINRFARSASPPGWASIASPAALDKAESTLIEARLIHLRSVLASQGIPRSRITTVEGALPAGSDIRVRLFAVNRLSMEEK